jgi:hypothetical protein
LEPSIIVINYCIIININYNDIVQLIPGVIVIQASLRNAIRRKFGSIWGCCYFLLEKKNVKCFDQYNVFAQSLAGWHLSDKYLVKPWQHSQLV